VHFQDDMMTSLREFVDDRFNIQRETATRMEMRGKMDERFQINVNIEAALVD